MREVSCTLLDKQWTPTTRGNSNRNNTLGRAADAESAGRTKQKWRHFRRFFYVCPCTRMNKVRMMMWSHFLKVGIHDTKDKGAILRNWFDCSVKECE